MIYVYVSAGFGENDNEFTKLIKIGFTDNFKMRNSQYMLHNPTIKLLYKYEDLGEDIEHKLHYLFKEYKYSEYGNEWFSYREEIIDFFNTHPTSESILQDKKILSIVTTYSHKIVTKDLDTILDIWMKVSYSTAEQALKSLPRAKEIRKQMMLKTNSMSINFYSKEYLYTLLKSFPEFTDDVILKIKEYEVPEIKDPLLKNKIDQVLNKFKYLFTTFIDKMKYLCSQKGVLDEKEFEVVLNMVPMEYKNYITTLGVEKIITLCYQKSNLDKEFKKLSTNQGLSGTLENKVYSVFNVGEKYSKSEIKEKLREIYKNLNYKSTPKANDLEKWFSIKEVLWRESGKMVHGFEIIKKKGD